MLVPLVLCYICLRFCPAQQADICNAYVDEYSGDSPPHIQRAGILPQELQPLRQHDRAADQEKITAYVQPSEQHYRSDHERGYRESFARPALDVKSKSYRPANQILNQQSKDRNKRKCANKYENSRSQASKNFLKLILIVVTGA